MGTMRMTNLAHQRMRDARKGLTIYLGLVLLGSLPLLWLIIDARLPVENPQQLPKMIALMWVPALASLITRLVRREGFKDVSFRTGGRTGARSLIIAVVFPATLGLIAYGPVWTLGLAAFSAPAYGMFAGVAHPQLRFALAIGFSMTVGAAVGVITAAGEEIGWRGYMLTRLMDAGVGQPLIVSGLIWGIWHVPGIISGQYAAGPYLWLSVFLFLAVAVSLSVFWGRLRLSSGSVWPAIAGHSAWNAVIEGPFSSYTHGENSALWVGESGVAVALSALALSFLLAKSSLLRNVTPENHRRSQDPQVIT